MENEITPCLTRQEFIERSRKGCLDNIRQEYNLMNATYKEEIELCDMDFSFNQTSQTDRPIWIEDRVEEQGVEEIKEENIGDSIGINKKKLVKKASEKFSDTSKEVVASSNSSMTKNIMIRFIIALVLVLVVILIDKFNISYSSIDSSFIENIITSSDLMDKVEQVGTWISQTIQQ